jgi:hypothetical protein
MSLASSESFGGGALASGAVLTRLRASLRRQPPTVVWIWLGLTAVEAIEALAVQDDGVYGALVIILFLSTYMLLFFLRFRVVWVITAVLNTINIIFIAEALVGGGSSRGVAWDINDFVLDLASLILLLTPSMRAYFFKRERAPKVPPRPDIEAHERRPGWRERLRSVPTPWSWQRNWPQTERLDLIKIEGAKTVIYPSPEAKERSWAAIGGLVLILAAQVVLARELFPRIVGVLGLILAPLVFLRVRKRWEGPALVLDDVGLKDPFRKHEEHLVLWREIRGLRIKRFGGTRYLLIDVEDPGEVVRRQSSRLAWLSLRLNGALGFSVVTLAALRLPMRLERLAWMILERVDETRRS